MLSGQTPGRLVRSSKTSSPVHIHRPLYYQKGPSETDVRGILLEFFSVEGKLLPEYLDISSVTVPVSPVESNSRFHKDRLEQTSK